MLVSGTSEKLLIVADGMGGHNAGEVARPDHTLLKMKTEGFKGRTIEVFR